MLGYHNNIIPEYQDEYHDNIIPGYQDARKPEYKDSKIP